MSDKGEQKGLKKPTEPKTIKVPDIEVTKEGATGEPEDAGKKSVVGTVTSFLEKRLSRIGANRSKSKSPEARKDKTQMGAESSKGDLKLATPPSKKGSAALFRGLFPVSKRGHCGEEENLCEEQVLPDAEVHLAAEPPPEDQGIYRPSPGTDITAEKCVMHNKSSSISSAPSDCSSLPDYDDTDIASPDNLNSPDEGKQK